MKVISEKIEGDWDVYEDTQVHGMIVGETTVYAKNTLILNGMVVGNLIIEPEAKAIVHGMVQGTVHNRGGVVEIYGTVGAVRDDDANQPSQIDQNAVVHTGRN